MENLSKNKSKQDYFLKLLFLLTTVLSAFLYDQCSGLWEKIYSAELRKYQQTPVQGETVDNWKLHYFRTIGFYDLKKKMHVQRTISNHTGLPVNALLYLKCINCRCNREKKHQITYMR